MRFNCKKNDVPFIWNEVSINSLYLIEFLCVEEEKKDKYIDVCFDAYWRNNLDISQEEILKQILSNCEIDENLFKQNIKNQK